MVDFSLFNDIDSDHDFSIIQDSLLSSDFMKTVKTKPAIVTTVLIPSDFKHMNFKTYAPNIFLVLNYGKL